MTNQTQQLSKLILLWNSTCFGHILCPSSGVFYCTFVTGKFHAGFDGGFQAESGWNTFPHNMQARFIINIGTKFNMFGSDCLLVISRKPKEDIFVQMKSCYSTWYKNITSANFHTFFKVSYHNQFHETEINGPFTPHPYKFAHPQSYCCWLYEIKRLGGDE
jgi:hypothetical protein